MRERESVRAVFGRTNRLSGKGYRTAESGSITCCRDA